MFKILEKDDEKTDPRWNARRAFRIEITTRDENKRSSGGKRESATRALLPTVAFVVRARARARG